MAANRDESTGEVEKLLRRLEEKMEKISFSDFGRMKVAQLKEFLSARLFSGERFRKDELIALCQQVQQLNV